MQITPTQTQPAHPLPASGHVAGSSPACGRGSRAAPPGFRTGIGRNALHVVAVRARPLPVPARQRRIAPLGKRVMDILLALIGLTLCLLPCLLIAVMIKASSRGPVLFWSDRVGRGNALFRMPKFRTMVRDAPLIATPFLQDPDRHVTPLGRILRRTSLDELPQFWAVLKGDMSIVGPRPALFNETRLIALRTRAGIHQLPPGLTGLAQVSGRDLLSMQEKVFFDRRYLRDRSLRMDVWILWRTVSVVLARRDISH